MSTWVCGGGCVPATIYPGFTCLLPFLPVSDGKETEAPQGDRVWGVGGCLYQYTCHHVCLVHSRAELRRESRALISEV